MLLSVHLHAVEVVHEEIADLFEPERRTAGQYSADGRLVGPFQHDT